MEVNIAAHNLLKPWIVKKGSSEGPTKTWVNGKRNYWNHAKAFYKVLGIVHPSICHL